jgi:hypothetical protein
VLLSAISELSEWGEFYVITGTSAGALAGLMFVVIALRAERGSQAIEEVEDAAAALYVVAAAALLFWPSASTTPGTPQSG